MNNVMASFYGETKSNHKAYSSRATIRWQFPTREAPSTNQKYFWQNLLPLLKRSSGIDWGFEELNRVLSFVKTRKTTLEQQHAVQTTRKDVNVVNPITVWLKTSFSTDISHVGTFESKYINKDNTYTTTAHSCTVTCLKMYPTERLVTLRGSARVWRDRVLHAKRVKLHITQISCSALFETQKLLSGL